MKFQREKRFRSAREFCSGVAIGISYPQYSRYEAGDQLPSLEQALSICAILGVSALETILEWNLAQVPATEKLGRSQIEGLLSGLRGEAGASARAISASVPSAVPLDDVIVFNRSHIKAFSSDPVYRDLFTYINSFGPDWISCEEIAAALDLSLERTVEMVRQLSDLGVIVSERGRCKPCKRHFYFPDDADFFELRNLNLTHNATRIMRKLEHVDLAQGKAFRGLVTRQLTQDQVGIVVQQLERLVGEVVAMPETDQPRTIYSVCVLMGERFSRASLEQPETV